MGPIGSAEETLRVRCCVAGGGPAGMMLGVLLARAGVDIVVLEKHADFLRDFRGDTIHPSTLEVMRELGILDELLKRPYQPVPELRLEIGGVSRILADFSQLKTRCRFIAMMPQWDFLNFLAEQGCRYPSFALRMRTEVTSLIENDGCVTGVRARGPSGELEICADLVVAADGRTSTVRECSGLRVEEIGAPMDVLWMRLSKHPSDPPMAFRFDRGKILVMVDRGEYWQSAFVIPKGSLEEIRKQGLERVRTAIAEIAPFLEDRLDELKDWEDLRLLNVRVDRLRKWYRPGLLCIGDAAHAMSPVGGVGINLAIQDAVAAANILASALRDGHVSLGQLAKVQRRRELPTRLTQGMQVAIQKQMIARVLGTSERLKAPWPLRVMSSSRFLRRLQGRLIGLGFRPEHVEAPDLQAEGRA